MPMSAPQTEENKALIRRSVEEVQSQHNLDVADELIDSNVVNHFAVAGVPPELNAVEEFQLLWSTMVAAFPDIHATIHNQVAEGDKPVRYRSQGLEVDCLVPRWADVAYHLEQDPRVFLVVLDAQAHGPSTALQRGSGQGSGQALRWLEYRGPARPVSSPDWTGLLPEGTSTVRPDDLYLVVHITPERIDLHDESRGWGARETLEL